MVKYIVTIANVEYPFTSLTYTRSYKIEAQKATVRLPNTPDLSISHDDFIEIKRDNELVWKGRVKNIIKESPTIILVEAYELSRSLKPLTAKNWREDTYAGTQVSNQLEGTELTAGTIENGNSITMEYGSGENAKFDRVRTLEDICFVTGYELYVAPDGTVDFKSQCGTDKSSTIEFKFGELLNYWTKPFTQNAEHKVKKIIVRGAGQGSTMWVGEAHTTDYTDGDPEESINRKSLVADETCDLAASALLDDFKNVVEYGAIDVTDTYTGHAYDVYDTIKVIDESVGVSGNYRIMEITRKFDSKTGEKTELKICNLTHITSNAEYLVERGEGFTNDLKRRGEDFGQTDQIVENQITAEKVEWNPVTHNDTPLENILHNGYFEEDIDGDGIPDFWEDISSGSGSISLTTSDSNKGGKCLKLSHGNGLDNPAKTRSTLIPVKPSQKYFFSVDAKRVSGDSPLYAYVYWYERDGSTPAGSFSLPTTISSSWATYSGQTTSPSNAYFARIILVAQSTSSTGEVRYDNVILSELRAAEPTTRVIPAPISDIWGGLTVPPESWKEYGYINAPSSDHEVCFVYAFVKGFRRYNAPSEAVEHPKARLKIDDDYFPSSDGIEVEITFGDSYTKWGVPWFFTIPFNTNGKTIKFELYNSDAVYDMKTSNARITAWGHSFHYHR